MPPRRVHQPVSLATFAKVWSNLERVDHLLALYRDYRGPGRGRRDVPRSDILRAAVVFLHATLEDFLRLVAGERLPDATADNLDTIPLAGSLTGRPEKFFLGALVNHRGKTVDAVIKESVQQHLSRASYNDTTEISLVLRSIGIDVAAVNGRFADLGELMKRRHHIVHQADRNPRTGRGQQVACSIGEQSVSRWSEAVRDFVQAVDQELERVNRIGTAG